MKITSLVAVLGFLSACQTSPEISAVAVPSVIRAETARATSSDNDESGTKFALATQGIESTKAARQVLAEGGNLVDAAVAASFVVSVERPQSTGIGGGGFMMFHEAKTGRDYAIDFRERAPMKATETMFLGKDGKPDANLSRNGILAVAVPGLVAGLVEIHQRFGSLPFERIVRPAIELAEKGFPVYPQLAKGLQAREERLSLDPAARAIFLDGHGKVWGEGHRLVQKDLAKTLRSIAREGRAGFYQGPVARQIVALSKQKKGLITQADLDGYQVKWREPVRGTFRGYDVVSMPPPSSGGVHVIQFLNFLENDSPSKAGPAAADSLSLEAQALQTAFADRAKFLGDPDFVKVPTKGLVSKEYAKKRRAEFTVDKARPAENVEAGKPEPLETTHMSFMDAEGNAISTTQTVNGTMGAALVAPGTGIVLNNEMDDFSAKAGTMNMYGAVGSPADAVAPRKTPLSSMSPTILLRDRRPVMAVGAPGGTRIISCVAQTIYNVLEYRQSLPDAVSSIRYHQQWKPDVLLIDPPGPGAATLAELAKRGYKVEIKPVGCTVMAVLRDGDRFEAVADPRDIGTSAAE